MMNRTKMMLCLVLFVGFFANTFAQDTGAFQSYSREKNIFNFTYRQASAQLELCTDDMVRVRVSWSGEFEAPEQYMVVTYDWPEVKAQSTDLDDFVEIKTEKLTARVHKSAFAVDFYDASGKLISSGISTQKKDYAVSATREMNGEEHFFGFGERMDLMDRRGITTNLNVGRGLGRPHEVGAYNIQEANYSPVPFFMSSKGYGIFFHNSYATHWDMGNTQNDQYTFLADGGELDYYFISGPEFASILDRYTDLTGKSPMLNRFAFGLHVGTYSGGTWGHEELTSTNYVVGLARKFRELGIPLDILHLDSTWRIFGENGGKGATSFEWRETFKNPEAMFDSLYAMNLNMVGVHLRPRFDNGKELKLLDQARALGLVYPENDNPGEFVNFFDQKSVDWWWENGVMRVASQGAMFLKTDEGSAFGRKANESDKVGPKGMEILKLHNVFPVAYAKAPYEKFQEYNGIRGMNHTREGYAGIQRYPFIFAGDWPSEWQYFGPVIRAGLNIGMSGVGYWSHCMGGFEHVADPELYKRWVQFGLLSPVAHLFGMEHPTYKEPWNYGEEGLRIFKEYDQIRYRLIPYMYSNAWEMYHNGLPLMRALVLHYQDDPNVYTIDDQYLLGGSIMIAPVTMKGAKTRSLYLPKGQWYGHWDGKVYEGKQYHHVVTPIDQMPIFYKAGAIIPTQPDVQFVDSTLPDTLYLDIYAGADGKFELYEDDGRSLAYQNGKYAVTAIEFTGNNKIKIAASEGDFELEERTWVIRVHGVGAVEAVSIQKGKKLKKSDSNEWSFDAEKQILEYSLTKKADQEAVIVVD